MVRSSSVVAKLHRSPRARGLALGIFAAMILPASVATARAAARTLNGTATAHLSLVHIDGSELIERGPVFTGTFTIDTHAGSITGHGTATPRGTGRYQSFSGTFLATSGTSRYAHVRGRGGLYGTYDRRSDEVVIQITGTLSY
jgi:hypothetical protein